MLSNLTALNAMEKKAKTLGFNCYVMTDRLQGDARTIGEKLIKETPSGQILLAGGETTLKITGKGKGGRNQALVLSSLPFLKKQPSFWQGKDDRVQNLSTDSGVVAKAPPQNDNKIKGYKLLDGKVIKPVFVKHLNRIRIPTLFPYLLEDICKIPGIEKIDFISSNPWDFSDELIDVIAKNPKITRSIHLPVQSGSTSVLKRMNRWYTSDDYLNLVQNLKFKIKNLKLSTDIIVGFCGETQEEFLETVDLVKKVGFYKAYLAMYSDRPMTAAHKAFTDDVPHEEKKKRWQVLEELINKPNFKRV